jgi:DNA-binding MarR family transcriptional regulator
MVRDRSKSVKDQPVATYRAAGQQLNVLFEVWLVSRATLAVLNRALAPSGLDAEEFAFYSMLAAPSRVTPSDLARWMAAPPTTVSSVIKRLERRGHARRDKNPADGRSYRVRLTPAGRRAHRMAARDFAPVLGQVVDVLGSEEPEVARALMELRRALDQVHRADVG